MRPRIARILQLASRRTISPRWIVPALALLVGGSVVLTLALVSFRQAAQDGPQQPHPDRQPALVANPSPTPTEDSPFAAITDVPPEPPRRSGIITHTVAEGDVLWKLAEHYNLRAETILWANEIDDPDLILIGQQLLIPPTDGVLYTVREGDSLAAVAHRYGVDVPAIVSSNSLSNPDQLVAGVDIFLPGARPARPALAAAPPSASPAESGQAVQEPEPIPLPPNIDELLAAGWLRSEHPTPLYKAAALGSAPLHELPAGARLERLDAFEDGRIQVRDPGDGKTRQAMTGWVSAMDLAVGRAPSPRELPLAYPLDTAMDIAHVFTPYRTQLDGAAYAEANCGPVAVGMILDSYGISVPSGQIRAEALNAQRMWGNNVGTLITALASVVEQHGLTPLDLRTEDGAIRQWTLDDVRAHIQQGHPVLVQTRYRSLPGRGGVAYYGDHYIVVTGLLPDGGFLYNDPIDHDGIGWDRVISAERLRTAMDASDRRYAYAAFAVGQ